MELYDVIVVGAGPAGTAAARLLSSEGLSVLVLERDTFPRIKPCAGWVSPWAFDLIGVSPEQYAERRTLVPFSSLVVWDRSEMPRRVALGRTVGYGIVRSEFDSFLASRIGGAGIRHATRVQTVESDAHGVVINGAYRGRVVIGAGGHHCPIAKKSATYGRTSGLSPPLYRRRGFPGKCSPQPLPAQMPPRSSSTTTVRVMGGISPRGNISISEWGPRRPTH